MTTSKNAFFPFWFLTALETLAASVSPPLQHICFSVRRHHCMTEPQATGPEGTSKCTKSILFHTVTVSLASSSFIQ